MGSDTRYAMRNKAAARRDANESDIVAELQAHGVVVYHIAQKDVPDLLCRYKGVWVPVEIKADGEKLTEGQAKFFEECHAAGAPCFRMDSIDDVPLFVAAIGTWYG